MLTGLSITTEMSHFQDFDLEVTSILRRSLYDGVQLNMTSDCLSSDSM